MRRYLPLLIAGSALIAAACRDTVAPTHPTTAAATLAKLGGGPRSYANLWDSTLAEADADTLSFTINPEGGAFRIGDFRLEYEANSVCNPETSGYGAEYWQQSCETLSEPITIHAKFWFQNGKAYADFSPNIRFSPDKNVFLWLKRPFALQNSEFVDYSIWYTTVVGDMRYMIDESSEDSSLGTVIDEDGRVRRRVRHFSGYAISTGEPCDDTAGDPQCVGLTDM